MMFVSNHASKGIGQLKSRNDSKEYQTDNEKSLFQCKDEFYLNLAAEANKHNITFDIYAGVPHSSESIDLASISHVVKETGGDLLYFSRFNPQKHAEKLYYDLFRNIRK